MASWTTWLRLCPQTGSKLKLQIYPVVTTYSTVYDSYDSDQTCSKIYTKKFGFSANDHPCTSFHSSSTDASKSSISYRDLQYSPVSLKPI